MLHYIWLYADAESKFVLSISANRCEEIWNLRSEYEKVCGMIINNNGKYFFTVNQIKINFELGLSIWYTTGKAASCLSWLEPLASELSVFKGSESIHGPRLT